MECPQWYLCVAVPSFGSCVHFRRTFQTKTLEAMRANAKEAMGEAELKRTLDWKGVCGSGSSYRSVVWNRVLCIV